MIKKGFILAVMLALYSSMLNAETLITEQNTAQASSSEQQAEKRYLQLVMSIFRSHVRALELLTNAKTKYSDNVTRHSIAIWRTTGLLEHSYPEELLKKDSKWAWKNKKEFIKNVRAVRLAAAELRQAANNWLDNFDRDNFVRSLENLKSKCRNCHGGSKNWP